MINNQNHIIWMAYEDDRRKKRTGIQIAIKLIAGRHLFP